MARISTYPLDKELVGSDYWLGSDANSNYATKNFSIDSVAEYMNRVATQTQALRFKYTNTVPINNGTLTFNPPGAGAVNFSAISTFVLSKNELTNLSTDISAFYTAPLAGSDVLITQCDDVSIWGVFTWESSTQIGTSNFYTINVTYKSGNNGLIANKDYFISLLTYAGTNDANVKYKLTPGATEFTIQHNLNKFCSVTVTSDNAANQPGNQVFCDVEWIDENNVKLSSGAVFTGWALLN
jgi:hypothetical protein